MGIKYVFQATKPEDVEMTLRITMKLRHWRQLRDQLDNKWPSWEFSSAIKAMIDQGEKMFIEVRD